MTDDRTRGLYGKYAVHRINDPQEKHAGCQFFVLDMNHDPHARAGLLAYAQAAQDEYPVLAQDLHMLVGPTTTVGHLDSGHLGKRVIVTSPRGWSVTGTLDQVSHGADMIDITDATDRAPALIPGNRWVNLQVGPATLRALGDETVVIL